MGPLLRAISESHPAHMSAASPHPCGSGKPLEFRVCGGLHKRVGDGQLRPGHRSACPRALSVLRLRTHASALLVTHTVGAEAATKDERDRRPRGASSRCHRPGHLGRPDRPGRGRRHAVIPGRRALLRKASAPRLIAQPGAPARDSRGAAFLARSCRWKRTQRCADGAVRGDLNDLASRMFSRTDSLRYSAVRSHAHAACSFGRPMAPSLLRRKCAVCRRWLCGAFGDHDRQGLGGLFSCVGCHAQCV